MFALVGLHALSPHFQASNDVLPHEPGNSDISGLGFFSQEILQNTATKELVALGGPKATAS